MLYRLSSQEQSDLITTLTHLEWCSRSGSWQLHWSCRWTTGAAQTPRCSRSTSSLKFKEQALNFELGARQCGAMKMAKSCTGGTAANLRRFGSEGHRFKTQCQQGLFAVESQLKCTILKWFECTISIHLWDVHTSWLYICFTYETWAHSIKDPSVWWKPYLNVSICIEKQNKRALDSDLAFMLNVAVKVRLG